MKRGILSIGVACGVSLASGCAAGSGPNAYARRDAVSDLTFVASAPQREGACAADLVMRDEDFLLVPPPTAGAPLLGAERRFQWRGREHPTRSLSQTNTDSTSYTPALDPAPSGPVRSHLHQTYAAQWTIFYAADGNDSDRAEALHWLTERSNERLTLVAAYRAAFQRALAGPCR